MDTPDELHRPDQYRQPGEFTMLELAEKVLARSSADPRLGVQAAAAGRSQAALPRHFAGAASGWTGARKCALEDGLKETVAYFPRDAAASGRFVTATRRDICRSSGENPRDCPHRILRRAVHRRRRHPFRPDELREPLVAGHGRADGAREAIGAGGYDLIVCEPNYQAPWRPMALLRILFSRRALTGKVSLARPFGLQLLRGRAAPPIAVVDLEDNASINRCDRYLLDACRLYFKRELPVDGWRLFANTLTARQPSRRFRADPANQARVAKLRPISLGIPPHLDGLLPVAPREKTADLFFVGNTAGLPAREQGMAELEQPAGGRRCRRRSRAAPRARGVLRALRRRPDGVVARRLRLGLLPPLRGGRLRFGAADQLSLDPAPQAARARRPLPLLPARARRACRHRARGAC